MGFTKLDCGCIKIKVDKMPYTVQLTVSVMRKLRILSFETYVSKCVEKREKMHK